MNCERIREQIPECLAGQLDTASRERLIEHLETCSACRADLAELNVVWRGLEAMPQPEPGRSMRSRFMETLEAYQEGYQEAQRRQSYTSAARAWWQSWWPARPAFQAAFAAALVIAGITVGRYLAAPQHPEASPEMTALRSQVDSLRQLVALSLLQEQSPSSRLRGVTYSYQITQPDRQVEQALLSAVNHDPNVNVRLSAVDALAKFAANPEIRRALVDSLPVQDSPLVQIAIIDLLAQLHDPGSLPALKKIAANEQADEAVRQRAASAAEKLETPK